MKKFNGTPFFSLLLVLTLFCNITFAQQTNTGSLVHDGVTREYISYIPASYDGSTSVPLVLSLHGYTQTANLFLSFADFRPIADTANFIVVYPQGLQDGFGQYNWNCFGLNSIDDVGFLSSLIDKMSMDYNIDLTRVYSTGFSNGGFMSHLLACELSEKIAAIATVGAGIPPNITLPCTTLTSMPVLLINGTTDSIVDYDTYATPAFDYWKQQNNCSVEGQNSVPDLDPNDGSTVDHIFSITCDNEVSVELFRVNNGNHEWPGPTDSGNNDINSSEEIWNFFSRYNQNGLITPIKIIGFSAKLINESSVQVDWEIAVVDAENTIAELQHSKDGRLWNTIFPLPLPSIDSRIKQSFIHHPTSLGVNFYRLRSTDSNQELDYSRQLQVVLESNEKLVVQNNLVQRNSIITIQNFSNLDASVKFVNSMGNTVLVSSKIPANQNSSISLSGLRPGVYFISFESAFKKYNQPVRVF